MSRQSLQPPDGAATGRPNGSSIGTGNRRSQIPVFNASSIAQHLSRRESVLATGAMTTPAHTSTSSQPPRRSASHDASTLLSTTRRDAVDRTSASVNPMYCSTVAQKPPQSRLGLSRVSNMGATTAASGASAMPFLQNAARVSKIHPPVTPTRLSEQVCYVVYCFLFFSSLFFLFLIGNNCLIVLSFLYSF